MPSPSRAITARLALEDGSIYHGSSFGSPADTGSTGEVVFSTAMTGYQEALTDPSYEGQILVMTTPMIGNYGVSADDVESRRPHVSGFVIRELSRIPSNYRASADLSTWLAKFGIPGIQGIDTRALVRKLRTAGVMRGIISTNPATFDADLVAAARAAAPMAGRNLAAAVSAEREPSWTDTLGQWAPDPSAPLQASTPSTTGQPRRLRVVALDCGAKRNIYRHLAERGCDVVILPNDASPVQIRDSKPDGLFISNGPGDPAAVDQTIASLREVAGEVPTFGICLGHQLLALALGAKTYKLKFGHRGANQPVRNERSGKVEITSQNHGFCVEPQSLLAAGCEVTHTHLNDGTVAGFRHKSKPIFSVQYHPEASPGPHDSAYLFDDFVNLMQSHSRPRPA